MSFPRYAKYKDSGVEWLGEVPEHWEVRRFKQVFREREARSVAGGELLLSVSSYSGVSPRSEIVEEGEHLSRAESLEGYKLCWPNDLVINIMLAWNRGLAFSTYHGIVSPAYSVFEVIDDSDSRYLNYAVRSNEYTRYFKAFSVGVVDSRLRLYPDTFGQLYCGVPPVSEQRRLASFLDRETAKIDALVAEQQRLVELSKEKRQAVISHAVTKGLNPDAPTKPSGIDWLGDIPTHWQVLPLHRLVPAQRRITYGIVQPGEPDANGRFMVRGQDYSSGWSAPEQVFRVSDAVEVPYKRARLMPGDLVMTIVGAGVGNVAIVPEWLTGANLTQTTARIAIDPTVADAAYVAGVLEGPVGRYSVGRFTKGAAQPGLNIEHVRTFPITVPPLDEQHVIAMFINRQSAVLDELIGEAERAITLLRERRSALISAAVTGKIDVRSLVDADAA